MTNSQIETLGNEANRFLSDERFEEAAALHQRILSELQDNHEAFSYLAGKALLGLIFCQIGRDLLQEAADLWKSPSSPKLSKALQVIENERLNARDSALNAMLWAYFTTNSPGDPVDAAHRVVHFMERVCLHCRSLDPSEMPKVLETYAGLLTVLLRGIPSQVAEKIHRWASESGCEYSPGPRMLIRFPAPSPWDSKRWLEQSKTDAMAATWVEDFIRQNIDSAVCDQIRWSFSWWGSNRVIKLTALNDQTFVRLMGPRGKIARELKKQLASWSEEQAFELTYTTELKINEAA